MSEARSVESVEFDDAPRPGAEPAGDATRQIRSVLDAAGIDVPCSLYNEALGLARDGHLGQAVARLQMLLCLDPTDGDALLLLAKVYAAQNRPQDALARLDAAVESGVVPPAGFRDHLEAQLRLDLRKEDEMRARVAMREQGEVRTLRAEARELRAENQRLEMELTDGVWRERTWKYLAIGLGVLVVGVVAMFGYALHREPAALDAAPPRLEPVAEVADVAEPAADLGSEAAPIAVTTPEPEPASLPAAAPTTPAASTPVAAPSAAASPAPVAAPDSASSPRIHVVGPNDTLYKLARRYYGDAEEWERIRDANTATLKNGIALSLGQKLVIP